MSDPAEGPKAVARLRTMQPVRGLEPDRWHPVLVRTPRPVPKPTEGQLWLDLAVSERLIVTVRAQDVEAWGLGEVRSPLAIARLAGRMPLEASSADH